MLRQCCIFETATEEMTGLSEGAVRLMPNVEWERSVLAAPGLVSWQAVKYHEASELQKALLKPSGVTPPELASFLDHTLLASIQTSSDDRAQPLLLAALDQLGDQASYMPQKPDQLVWSLAVSCAALGVLWTAAAI